MNFLGGVTERAKGLGQGLTQAASQSVAAAASRAEGLLLQADQAAGDKLGVPHTEGEDVHALQAELAEALERERRAVQLAAEQAQAEAALTTELATVKAEAAQLQEREKAIEGMKSSAEKVTLEWEEKMRAAEADFSEASAELESIYERKLVYEAKRYQELEERFVSCGGCVTLIVEERWF